MRVLYHQRTRAPEAEERELKATQVPLVTLLSESDWIMPQLPTLPARAICSAETSSRTVKPGGCIVNVANAAIINRDALLEALRAGRLGGVALDVHYQEPVADDDPLLGFDNVILTPRMAGSPRHNGLNDFEELITGLAREVVNMIRIVSPPCWRWPRSAPPPSRNPLHLARPAGAADRAISGGLGDRRGQPPGGAEALERDSASSSWSRTAPAPAARSASTSSPRPCRTEPRWD